MTAQKTLWEMISRRSPDLLCYTRKKSHPNLQLYYVFPNLHKTLWWIIGSSKWSSNISSTKGRVPVHRSIWIHLCWCNMHSPTAEERLHSGKALINLPRLNLHFLRLSKSAFCGEQLQKPRSHLETLQKAFSEIGFATPGTDSARKSTKGLTYRF